MPIYEYRCTRCDTTFARLQRVGQGSDEVRCPNCESPDVERLLSTFASAGSASGSAASCSGGGGFT